MEMLIDRIEKERIQYQQHIYSELEAQRVQMQNMMAAKPENQNQNLNLKQAEQEREAFIKENKPQRCASWKCRDRTKKT